MHAPRFTFGAAVGGKPVLPRALTALALSLAVASALLLAGCGDSGTDNQSAADTWRKSDDGSIKADPNPAPAGEGYGRTTISWTTKGGIGPVEVHVSERGQPEVLFAQSAEGSKEVPWIQAGGNYEFRLYAGQGPERRLLDKVQVTRAQ